VTPGGSTCEVLLEDAKSGAVPLTAIDRAGHLREEIRTDEIAVEERVEERRQVLNGGNDPSGCGQARRPPFLIPEPRRCLERFGGGGSEAGLTFA
jgi:hypothetical protein